MKLVLQNSNSQKEDNETFDKDYKQLGYNAEGNNSDIKTWFFLWKGGSHSKTLLEKGKYPESRKKK